MQFWPYRSEKRLSNEFDDTTGVAPDIVVRASEAAASSAETDGFNAGRAAAVRVSGFFGATDSAGRANTVSDGFVVDFGVDLAATDVFGFSGVTGARLAVAVGASLLPPPMPTFRAMR